MIDRIRKLLEQTENKHRYNKHPQHSKRMSNPQRR